jgi:hypothetical protein
VRHAHAAAACRLQARQKEANAKEVMRYRAGQGHNDPVLKPPTEKTLPSA